MKLKRHYFFAFLSVLMVGTSFSQTPVIDSLLNVLKTIKEDTTKVAVLTKLFSEYEYKDRPKAKAFLDEAIEISKRNGNKKDLGYSYIYLGYYEEDQGNYPGALKNYIASLELYQSIGDKKGIGTAYNNIGIVYKNQGNYSEALKNHFACLKIMKELSNKVGQADSYNSLGIAYEEQGNYSEALKYHLESLKIREILGDKKGISTSYNNIGNVYSDQRNFTEALKNYFAGLKIRESIGDKRGMASTYNGIGNVYFFQGNYSEALKNYSASLEIKKEIGNKHGMASSYENIGNVYSALAEKEKDPKVRSTLFDQALKNLFDALRIQEDLGEKARVCATTTNIGIAYTKEKKYKEGDLYLTKAKKLATEFGDKESLRSIYQYLTKLDSANGNYKGAYENDKLYVLYRDSLDNEESRKKTIQSQMNYDFEKKEAVADAEHKKELENQEALSEEKSRKQRIVLFLVLGSLVLVLGFAGFIFRSLRITRKQKMLIEKQKSLVEKQKLEVEQQKHLVEEHQKEIIDSITYARRIQRSLLPTEKYIERSLIRLKKNN